MSGRRVHLSSSYILHHRPYRDTSRILEVLSREHGRLTVFAKGVSGSKKGLAACLQPFQRLLLSWSGRGEAKQLSAVEVPDGFSPLPGAELMSGFYLNELILKLTTRHDALPAVFDAYDSAIQHLKTVQQPRATLRIFEKRLLDLLGYGLELTIESASGEDIQPERYYTFRFSEGLRDAAVDAPGAMRGVSIIDLAQERFATPQALVDAQRLLKEALWHVLEGRELNTRKVARELSR
jgi:DNA repair protein RecO (recombination protein O)